MLDMTRAMPFVAGARLAAASGPTARGSSARGRARSGSLPGQICKPGPVGVVSRSGTLTYEVVHQLTGAGIGQSTCLGIGGDPIIGTNFIDCLALFEADPETRAVVMIGEIGGTDEQEAAAFVESADGEAGRGVHRRADSPAGQAHGSRRGDHLRQRRNRRGEDGGVRESRDRGRPTTRRHRGSRAASAWLSG